MLSSNTSDRLFHNVVDTSAAANEILRWINREPYDDGIGLPGTFCFYALDRLQIYPPIRGHVCISTIQ
jgi:hypothetical protein